MLEREMELGEFKECFLDERAFELAFKELYVFLSELQMSSLHSRWTFRRKEIRIQEYGGTRMQVW